MKTTYLLMLVLIGLLLSGCGFIFNQPLVGPDGTTALFVGDDGTYSMLPEGNGHLALLHDGNIEHRTAVASQGDSGVLDWSIDGSKVLFIDTEQDEYGQPIAWNVFVSGVQSGSQPAKLFRSEEIILAPAFTARGNITYLKVKDNDDLPQLLVYDTTQKTNVVLKDNVISYQRLGWEGTLIVISQTSEGSLNLAHVSSFDSASGMTEEIASFFLSQETEEMLFLLPASFLWNIAPTGDYVALALYDRALVTPQVEENNEQPPLYFIDREEDSAYKISDNGVVPAFSPDGSLLSFVGATGEKHDTPVIFIYDIKNKETRILDDTLGAVTLFWIDNATLGYVIESKNDTYRVMKVSLATGEVTPLFPRI